MRVNPNTENYEQVTVFGQPALFTSLRLYRDQLPEGVYAYDVRHSDDGFDVADSGSAQALREGEVGRVFGMDNYYSQHVYEHVAGTATGATSPKVNGAVAAGAYQMAVDATTMTGGLKKGDLLTIGSNTYVVTEDTADASANAIATVKFYPAAPEGGIANDAAITFVADSVRNMGFHKNAFAFVTRALPLPSDAQGYVVSFNGITLRVVRSYDISTKKEIMSMDVLYGFKTVYPELAQVRLG